MMTTGNDFKRAIGNPDKNFEKSVQQALNEVLMDEQRKKARAKRPLRFVLPAAAVVAAAACAVIFIGGPGEQPDRVTDNNAMAMNTAQPAVAAASETDDVSAYSPEETEEAFALATDIPTQEPTQEPTAEPTEEPTQEPTEEPTQEPTEEPTEEPTQEPTVLPTPEPAHETTESPAYQLPGKNSNDSGASAALLPDNHWMLQDTLNTDINSLYPGYTYTETVKDMYGNRNWMVRGEGGSVIACEFTRLNGMADLISDGAKNLPTLTVNLTHVYENEAHVDALMANAAPWLNGLYTISLEMAAEADPDARINTIALTFDANNMPRLCELTFGRNSELYIAWKQDSGSNEYSVVYLNTQPDRDWYSAPIVSKGFEPIEVEFADAALEAAICESIGWQGKLTPAQLEAVTELRITDTTIESLSGLENCVNLEYLQLSGCGIDDDDLMYIAKLPALKTLLLANNEITDITWLAELDLTSLHISYNEITNLWPLSGMTNLKELYLDSNNLFGTGALKPLTGLTGLNTLYLQDCGIEDVEPLAELIMNSNIEEINLCGNPIEDYSSIADLGVLRLYYDK